MKARTLPICLARVGEHREFCVVKRGGGDFRIVVARLRFAAEQLARRDRVPALTVPTRVDSVARCAGRRAIAAAGALAG